MDIKVWLSRAYKIDQQIASKLEQIEMWRCLAQKVTSDPSALPRSGGGHSNRLEEYCIKIADAEAEIKRQLEELVDIKREIEAAIAKVHDVTVRVLLEQRYLLCKGWEDIGAFMGYSDEYVRKHLHRQALAIMREIYTP